jgi:uncharacterized protein
MSTPDTTNACRLSRFGYLMGLYGENYRRLQRLFEVDRLQGDSFRSSIDDGLDLRLQIIERHRYTIEMRLTYELVDPVTGEPDPSAYLRCYRDARVAEVTHCYIGRRWQDVLGLDASARTVVGHRLRMNGFLSKWLEFLAEQGHSRFTLVADDSPLPDLHPQRRVAIVGA